MTPPLPTPAEAALGHFQQYLRQERSLSESTVINYTPVARLFLSERFPKGALHFQRITAADITAFVQRQATLVTSKRAPLVVTALRSFLRYLFLRGIVAIDLATCVPTIATWSLSNVPRFLAGEQIQKILGSCDKETAIGRRDYALLLLLAPLGLRAGEVVALTLDDFDWEAGLVTVRGKGKRVAQMPLPSEVGTAIADYLSTGRPRCSSRRVFIRAKAPLTGFANSIAICSLVDRAMERAGGESEYRVAHWCRNATGPDRLNPLPGPADWIRPALGTPGHAAVRVVVPTRCLGEVVVLKSLFVDYRMPTANSGVSKYELWSAAMKRIETTCSPLPTRLAGNAATNPDFTYAGSLRDSATSARGMP